MGKKVDLDVAHHATHYASPRDVENRFFSVKDRIPQAILLPCRRCC